VPGGTGDAANPLDAGLVVVDETSILASSPHYAAAATSPGSPPTRLSRPRRWWSGGLPPSHRSAGYIRQETWLIPEFHSITTPMMIAKSMK
jgi:hypothetical protein